MSASVLLHFAGMGLVVGPSTSTNQPSSGGISASGSPTEDRLDS